MQKRDSTASVKQRLLDLARTRREEFNLVLVRYTIERLLYRLSRSEHSSEFVLKGALLFHLWTTAPHRATRDVDLLGRGSADTARLQNVFRAVCETIVEEDGLAFLAESVQAQRIPDDARGEEIRVALDARLGAARIPLQVDVCFGDAVVPSPQMADLPVLLDHPAPRLRVYRRETVVAEKLQAVADLGLAGSRLKDFFDLRFLALTFDFAGTELTEAIEATFSRRRTPIPEGTPAALTDEFAADATNRTQWRAFLRRTGLDHESLDLPAAVSLLRSFLLPPMKALRAATPFGSAWTAGGPWRP